MRFPVPVLALGLLAACGSPPITYPGTDMYLMFPFDGVRTWEFINTDATVSYKIVAEMRSTEPDVVDGINTYPIDYFIECVQNDPECVDGLTRTIVWANDEIEGTYIYEWTEGVTNTTVFDPPLKVANKKMKKADMIETTTAGATWTSTLEDFEPCQVRLNVNWNCAQLVIDDGDGDDLTGAGLVGSYWGAVGYNIVTMQFPGEEGLWELSSQTCEEDCQGIW